MKVSSPPPRATEMTPNHGNFSCLTSRVAYLESKLTVRKQMLILDINARTGFIKVYFWKSVYFWKDENKDSLEQKHDIVKDEVRGTKEADQIKKGL